MTGENELRARHLEMLQQIIARMSQNSFTIRGWSITLVTAAFALLATQDLDRRVVLFALIPTWIFWGLDASYFRTERLFRALYTPRPAGSTTPTRSRTCDPSTPTPRRSGPPPRPGRACWSAPASPQYRPC